MLNKKTFTNNSKEFKNKLIYWIAKYPYVCYLDSNEYYNGSIYKNYELFVGISSKANHFIEGHGGLNYLNKFLNCEWAFGFICYDLKNELEHLSSDNIDKVEMPLVHFFHPELLFEMKDREVVIHYRNNYSEHDIDVVFNEINNTLPSANENSKPLIQQRVSKDDYISTVKKIKQRIALGDIYEMNYCMEFFIEDFECNPYLMYVKLNAASPMPFSCFYRMEDHYLMCASPERFLMKKGNKIISQPIKGTFRRDLLNQGHDKILKQQLFNDPKEKVENVMIVDLVRNDLSRTADKGTVKVEELYGIYSFPQVHQMISTITSNAKEDIDFVELIKTTFPMGSMTGAPKIGAMQLIEDYEKTKRGLYSGSVGYITPDGDFDFNVVIRSILYNARNKYLSFMVGSAITFDSIPEKEYEECLLKAKAIMGILS